MINYSLTKWFRGIKFKILQNLRVMKMYDTRKSVYVYGMLAAVLIVTVTQLIRFGHKQHY